ncbi:MAG: SBBP repeat-containing protein [Flavobacteriales bacterium]
MNTRCSIDNAKGICALLFASLLVPAQAQTVQWMRQGGISGEGRGAGSDASGNAFVCGTVGNPALFDDDTTASHFSDAFIAKYDDAGNIQWVRTGGSDLIDQANDIVTDANGNSYVTGFFSTNGPFPTVIFDGTVLQGLGGLDLFLAKYDNSGALQWIRFGGGVLADEGRGVALDASGNVVVSGYFQGTAVFGNDTLVSNGLSDVLLLKYDPNGNLIWSLRDGGTGDDKANKLAALGNGDLGVVGSFQGSAGIAGDLLFANGLYNAFVARYAGIGIGLWGEQAGSTLNFAGDEGFDVDAAPNGDLVFCGEIAGPSDFDGFNVVPNGGTDLFIARYDGNGDLVWVHHAGGPQFDHAYGLAVDADNNSYVTGQADDGPNTVFDSITLAPFGNEAVFIAKYDAAGAIQWVKRYAPGFGRAVALLGNGCLYFTGGASGIVGQPAFDSIPWQYTDRAIFTARFCDASPNGVADQASNAAAPPPFPNPCNGTFTLHIPQKAHTVTIEDAQGRVVQRVPVLSSGPTTLQIETPGVYCVTILSDAGRVVQRVVVDRGQ